MLDRETHAGVPISHLGEFIEHMLAHEDDVAHGVWDKEEELSTTDRIKRFLPRLSVLTWGAKYRLREDLGKDAVAGLIVAIMLIPQAMAYAALAGVPPIYGLYASTIPLLLYPLFGTSREAGVGPVAMTSLLVAAAASTVADQDSTAYVQATFLLSFLVGAIQILLGCLKAGYVVNFLSAPVLTGFVSAAAFIIASTQLSKLMGYTLARSPYVYITLFRLFEKIGSTNGNTVLIAVESIVLLLAFKRVKASGFKYKGREIFAQFPGTLLVVIINILIAWLAKLETKGVVVVGTIPSGLPPPASPFAGIKSSMIANLLPSAFAISMVAFMESISVSKATARSAGYTLDASQELVGLGASNLVGSFFQCFPVTGSLPRTVVASQSGSRSPLYGIFTAVIVGIVLLALTPLFYHLPDATLAAIIVVACASLVDVGEAKRLKRISRDDFIVYLSAFGATILLGIELGILIGCAISIARIIQSSARPHWARLGRLPGTRMYKNIQRFDNVKVTRGIEILRIDAELYFGNISFVSSLVRQATHWTPGVRYLIVDFCCVSSIDTTAADGLSILVKDLDSEKRVEIHFANVHGQVEDALHRLGLHEALGKERIHVSVFDAECAVRGRWQERLAEVLRQKASTASPDSRRVLEAMALPPGPQRREMLLDALKSGVASSNEDSKEGEDEHAQSSSRGGSCGRSRPCGSEEGEDEILNVFKRITRSESFEVLAGESVLAQGEVDGQGDSEDEENQAPGNDPDSGKSESDGDDAARVEQVDIEAGRQ